MQKQPTFQKCNIWLWVPGSCLARLATLISEKIQLANAGWRKELRISSKLIADE
jgi:hypothetical protein